MIRSEASLSSCVPVGLSSILLLPWSPCPTAAVLLHATRAQNRLWRDHDRHFSGVGIMVGGPVFPLYAPPTGPPAKRERESGCCPRARRGVGLHGCG